MTPEHVLIIIAEVGAATGVLYGLFRYLFGNAFNSSIQALKESVDLLNFNVSQQTKMLDKSLEQVEEIEREVNGHETRLQLLERKKHADN